MRTEAGRPGEGAIFRVYRLRKVAGVDKEDEIVRLRTSRLDIGTRSPSTLVLDDPVAAPQHCSIEFDGSGFELFDGDNSTGTYRNGVRVASSSPLEPGDTLVVGVSTLTARVDSDDGRPRLNLELKENSFFFKQKDRKEFRSDPDQWVVSEWSFGRIRGLAAANWLVTLPLLALLPLAFFALAREPLFDPGPLVSSHADLFDASIPRTGALADMAERAQREGCATCHDSFGGTPMSKCAECHRDVMEGQHPFHSAPFDATLAEGRVDRDFSAHDCNICHTDHREDGAFKPIPDETRETCTTCHSEGQLSLDHARPPSPVATDREVEVPFTSFSHAAHLEKGIDCALCHGTPSVAGTMARHPVGSDPRTASDFSPVTFETCQGCHDKAAARTEWEKFWPAPEKSYDLPWHGAEHDGAQECLTCHDRLYEAPLRETVGTLAAEASLPKLGYGLARYDHAREFEAHAGADADTNCVACHAGGPPAVLAEARGVFWHALHSSSVFPESSEDRSKANAQCVSCHHELLSSDRLAEGTFVKGADDASCKECHRSGETLTLRPDAVTANVGAERRRAEFPHDVHVRAMGRDASLEAGCFSCHSFESDPGDSAEERAYRIFPRTTADAGKCLPCHDDHGAIAGGACRDCHPTVDGVADGVYAKKVSSRKNWPASNAFDHGSAGHRDESCTTCHGGEKSLERSKSVLDVPVPVESDDACRKCHVENRARFHWR